ncbi:hypothetical protein QNM99_11490 [Pseudomonas sp. PCH446]
MVVLVCILVFGFLILTSISKGPNRPQAEISGTDEYKCREAARSAVMSRFGTSFGEASKLEKNGRWVFIGSNAFFFDKADDFSLIHEAGDVNLGITAWYLDGMAAFASLHPDIIKSYPVSPGSIILRLTCEPGKIKYDSARWYRPDVPVKKNAASGLNEYAYGASFIVGLPVDSAVNPDGSKLWVFCNFKICSTVFYLLPEVHLTYSYPVEQKADAIRLNNFITQHLLSALKERAPLN